VPDRSAPIRVALVNDDVVVGVGVAHLLAPYADRAVCPWNVHPALIDGAMGKGAHGYVSTTLPAPELVAASESIAAGEIVVCNHPSDDPWARVTVRHGRRMRARRGG
jgi:hypothetical protein